MSAQDHDDPDPLPELARVVVLDALVDGGTHGEPDERLGHHPADAKERVQSQEPALVTRPATRDTEGRIGIGRAGVRLPAVRGRADAARFIPFDSYDSRKGMVSRPVSGVLSTFLRRLGGHPSQRSTSGVPLLRGARAASHV